MTVGQHIPGLGTTRELDVNGLGVRQGRPGQAFRRLELTGTAERLRSVPPVPRQHASLLARGRSVRLESALDAGGLLKGRFSLLCTAVLCQAPTEVEIGAEQFLPVR